MENLGVVIILFGVILLCVGMVKLVVDLLKKKKKTKFNLILIALGLVLPIIGALFTPETQQEFKKQEQIASEKKESIEKENKNKKEQYEKTEIEKKEKEKKQKENEEKEKNEKERIQKEKEQAERDERKQKAADLKDPNKYRSDVTYENLARTPNDFKKEKISLNGKVIQVIEGDSGITNLRLAVNSDYNSIVFVEYRSSIVPQRILEDDLITIYGESTGLYSYKSTMGGQISIPGIIANIIQ